MKKVFISYRRNYAKWVARAVRQALERREIEVFMDVEDIDSGRFENVILNQIGLCEHFIVLLTPDTARALGTEGDWVSRELQRALELEKNVISVLVDDASANDISPAFTRRKAVLELNFFRLPHDLFEQAITVLIERFLTQPTLQELRIRTAKEHFETAKQAADGEDWEVAEAEYGKAVASQTRPEYFFGRGLAKYQLRRYDEALNDFDAAISLDPFTFELMKNKFNLLQELGRLEDALNFRRRWDRQAEMQALNFGSRITERLDRQEDIISAVHSIPELVMLYGDLPRYHEISESLATLIEHAPAKVANRLLAELKAWGSAGTLGT
jgi:tetratricopeptide (TPR) repeat protein